MSCPTGGNVVTLLFSQHPALMSSGGSVATTAPGYSDPSCGQSDIIVFNSGGKYVALSAGCNHQCCPAKFNGSNIRCPCHGAEWDLSGNLTRGPASANLASLQVCSDATGVYVSF
jgi:Rieske Fe-S protein